jgi:hypothetical protein
MPVPTETATTSFAKSQAYGAPVGGAADVPVYEHLKAYLLHPNPGVAEVVNVTAKYAKVLGVDPGGYVVPDLVAVLAVPGGNGVRGLSDWSMEKLLSTQEGGGYYEIAKHLAMAGTPLLDPFSPLPREFLPSGVTDGGYLRFVTTQHNGTLGRCHHLAFEHLESEGIGEKADLKIDREAYDAWRIWLVTSGKTPEVNPAAIRRGRKALEGRIAKIKGQPLDEKQLERSLAPRESALKVLDDADTVKRGMGDKPATEKPAKKASDKPSDKAEKGRADV